MNKKINFEKFKKLEKKIKNFFKNRDRVNLSKVDERVSLKLKSLGAEKLAKKIKPKSKKKIIYAVSIATSIVAIAAISFFLPTMRSPLLTQDPLTELAIQPPTPTLTLTPKKYAESGYLAVENNFTLKTKKPFNNDVKKFIEIKPEIDYDIKQNTNQEIEIVPKDELKPGEIYTINLKKGVQFENHSETSKDYTWRFKAEPNFTVTGITPREEASNVPIDASIEFEFNHKNINAENFKKHFNIEPSIPGEFEKHGMKIVFLPKDMLETHTIYTITVDKDFTNSEGENLGEKHSATFATSDSTKAGDRKTENTDIYWSESDSTSNITEKVYAEVNGYNSSGSKVNFTLYEISKEALIKNMLNFDSFYHKPNGAKEIHSDSDTIQDSKAQYSYTPPKKGIYLLEAKHEKQRIYRPFVYSTINLVASFSDRHAEGWVWEMNQDKTLPGISLRNYSYRNGVIKETNNNKSDKDGFFNIDNPNVVMAEYKGNYAFLNANSHYIESVNYDSGAMNFYGYGGGYGNEKYVAYINTDKPRYYKGDTIKFSSIIKEIQGKQLATPSSELEITVKTDTDYKKVFKVDPKYGMISGEFTVPMNYDGYSVFLSVRAEGETIESKYIEIRDSKKSKYQVAVTSTKDKYIDGEEVVFDLEAVNYSNQPASNETFETKLYKAPQDYVGKNYENITDYIYVESNSEMIKEKKIKLNSEGRYTYKFEPDLNKDDEQFTAYKLEFFSKGEKAFASHSIIVANSPTDIQVNDTKNKNYDIGDDATLRLSAHDLWNEEPSANSKVKVTVKRSWYKKIQVGTQYDEELKENVPNYENKEQIETFYENTVQVNKTKNITIRNLKKGTYYVNLNWSGSKKDETHRIYVSESTPNTAFETFLNTKSNRSINAGEQIKTNLKSIIDAKGIIFIKSGDIYKWETFELKADQEKEFSFDTDHTMFPSATVCAFITNDHEPKNNYSTFHNTGKFISSSCSMTEVKSDQYYLDIQTSYAKDTYEPGETATLNFKVTDKNGNPVKTALNIRVTNQALLDSASVSESSSEILTKNLHLQKSQSSDLRSSIPAINYTAGGGGATDGGGGGEPIRKDFRDSAYWNSFIETDDQGKAQIEVKLPDNLTTWNIQTIATSEKAQFGITNSRIKTKLDQTIEVNLPKFVRVNDVVKPEIKIRNWSNKLNGKVVIECSGCKEEIKDEKITVESKSNKLLKPQIEIKPQAKNLVITAKLYDNTDNNLIDGVERTIPIYSNSKITEDVKSTIISREKTTATQTFDLGEEIRPDVTEIEITLSKAFAIDQFQTPLDVYTTSTTDISGSILHDSFMYRHHNMLKPDTPKDKIRENLLLSYQKLINNQADSGGFSWFDYDAVSLESSVIAAQAIEQLTVNEIIEKDLPEEKSLENYFATILHSSDYSSTEYVLAVLGYSYLDTESAMLYLPELEENIDYKDPLTLASLMQAYNNTGSTGKTAELATHLEETVIETDRAAYWMDKESKFKVLQDSDYITAMVYLAISPIEEWELKQKTRNWLVNRTYKNFSSTGKKNQMNYALAVSDVDNLYGYKESEEITIYINNKKFKTVTLDQSDNFYNKVKIDIGSKNLNKGENKIQIESSGNSDIYALTKAYKFTPLNEIEANKESDLHVDINYFDMNGNKLNNNEIANMPANKYIKGQVVVKSKKEYENIVIRTQLPGGLEPVGFYEDDISTDTWNNYIGNWNLYTSRWGEIDTDFITFNSSTIKKGKEHKYEFLTLTRFEGEFNSGSSEAHIEFFPDIENTIVNPTVKIK